MQPQQLLKKSAYLTMYDKHASAIWDPHYNLQLASDVQFDGFIYWLQQILLSLNYVKWIILAISWHPSQITSLGYYLPSMRATR